MVAPSESLGSHKTLCVYLGSHGKVLDDIEYLCVPNFIFILSQVQGSQQKFRGLLVVHKPLWDDIGVQDLVPVKNKKQPSIEVLGQPRARECGNGKTGTCPEHPTSGTHDFLMESPKPTTVTCPGCYCLNSLPHIVLLLHLF